MLFGSRSSCKRTSYHDHCVTSCDGLLRDSMCSWFDVNKKGEKQKKKFLKKYKVKKVKRRKKKKKKKKKEMGKERSVGSGTTESVRATRGPTTQDGTDAMHGCCAMLFLFSWPETERLPGRAVITSLVSTIAEKMITVTNKK